MIIYYIIAVLLLALTLLKPKLQKIFLPISFIILFFIIAFRDVSVGTDTKAYEFIFNRLKNTGYITKELGFTLLNQWVLNSGGNFRVYLIIISLLTLIPLYYAVSKISIKPALSILLYYNLYFYFYSFNISRQILALSIVLLGAIFLLKNKRLLFCLFVLLASTFHITALISLPLIFIDRIPDKIGLYIISISLSLITGIFLTVPILGYLGEVSGYGRYLLTEDVAAPLSMTLLMTNFFFVFVLFTSKGRGSLFKLFFVYVLLMNLFDRFPFDNRLTIYFSIYQIFFLPLFIENNKLKYKSVAYSIVILYSFVIMSRRLSLNAADVIPYINVLF